MAIRGWLKQSTAVTLKVGPFVDETDGKTAETALTISQADVRLSKNGGNMAQKNEATSLTHDEVGMYDCPIDTTDTNTLGILILNVHESGALPVVQEYMVCPANIWDSLFGADLVQIDATQILGAAISTTTAQLGVNVVQLSTDATAADNAEAFFDGSGYAGTNNVIPSVTTVTGNVNGNVAGSVGSVTGAVGSVTGAVGSVTGAVGSVAAGGITASSIASDALGALELATDAVDEIVQAVWNEPTAGNVTGGTFGAQLKTVLDAIQVDTDAIEVDTQDIQSRLPAALVSGRIDASVGAMASATVTAAAIATDAIGALELASDAVAEIADAVWDEATSGHTTGGSFGAQAATDIDQILTNTTSIPTSAQNADAVWDELLSGHTTAGSAGDALGDASALVISTADAQLIADTILSRSLSSARASGVGDAELVRSLLGALSKLVNKVDTDASRENIRVYRENDTTVAYTQPIITSPGADPIKQIGGASSA